MTFPIDVFDLHEITLHAIDDHLFDLYTEHVPPEGQHLGYVDKSTETIVVNLPRSGMEVQVRQSLTELSSKTQTSSTGFICWQAAAAFADWVVSDAKCPFHGAFKGSNGGLTVVELGAGVGAVCASVLGPLTRHYVATDQRHILKLLKANFAENVPDHRYTSSTLEPVQNTPKSAKKGFQCAKVDFVEFDWERLHEALYNFSEVEQQKPDLVIACDTVYNEYLVPPFLEAISALLGPQSTAVVALQLRDEDVMHVFLEKALGSGLNVYSVPDHLLSKDLIQGFVVYVLTPEKQHI